MRRKCYKSFPTNLIFLGFANNYISVIFQAEHWLKALNEGKIVGTVMVDFRKAFDLVDHSLLLKKLAIRVVLMLFYMVLTVSILYRCLEFYWNISSCMLVLHILLGLPDLLIS